MKLLFICNAALQRSPTGANLFKKEHETDYAGIYSIDNPLTQQKLEWADVVFVMEEHQRKFIEEMFPELQKKIINLDVPDMFIRNDPRLIGILEDKVKKSL